MRRRIDTKAPRTGRHTASVARRKALALAVSATLCGVGAGSARAFPATMPLSGLDGADGFMIDGEAGYDRSGNAVSAAGDINGDGMDDLIIGAPNADPNGTDSGRSYVLFGSNVLFADDFE